jgi:hypothetical protein
LKHGIKYKETEDLDVSEIAKLVRADIKAEFPDLKPSVTIARWGSGMYSGITIYVKKENAPYGGWWHLMRPSPEQARIKQRLREILGAYNIDYTEPDADYHSHKFSEEVKFER